MSTLPNPLTATGMFGLWVDLGRYNPAVDRWVREPFAEFTCRHGCVRSASGARDVAAFCRAISTWHIVHCPGKTAA